MAIPPTGNNALFNQPGIGRGPSRIAKRRKNKQCTCNCVEKAAAADDAPVARPTAAAAPAAAPPGKGQPGELLSPGVRRIRGNLCNVHGRYGPCDDSGSGIRKKPPKGRGGRAAGGKGPKAAKPKKTDEQRAAERQQRAQERQAETTREQAENITKVADATDLGDHLANLNQFAQGKTIRPQDIDELTKQGLLEIGSDGAPRKTEQANVLLNAAKRGDVQGAKDAASRARDQLAKRQEAAGKRTAAQAARETAKRDREAAQAKKRAEAAKRGSGKRAADAAAEEAKPKIKPGSALARRLSRSSSPGAAGVQSSAKPKPKPKPEKAPKPSLAPALVDAAQQLSAGGQMAVADLRALIRNGLARIDRDGMPVLTATGLNATKKPQSSNEPEKPEPIRTGRKAETYGGTKRSNLDDSVFAGPARSFPIKTAQDVRDAVMSLGRTKHSKALVRRGIIRRARAIGALDALPDSWKVQKEQTAQQKAMFANMGGGGGGGGGRGGKARTAAGAGGARQSTLWEKGPDGKRVPQAGFVGGPGPGPKRTPSTDEGKARAADVGKPAHGQTVGATTKAYGNDPNQSYTMRHELVDMGDIQASNTANGGINPKYDASLQPRDRSRSSSQAQIADVAQNMNPEVMTTDFHRIDSGSPIIDRNGNVLSGNGRTLALQRAAEMHPDKYAAYKAEIKAKAREAGIDPAAVDGMKNPVLVRRLEGNHDAAAFAREANSSGTLRMSPLEQAKVDAGQISNQHMLKLHVTENGDIDRALRDKTNKPFIDDFLANVPDNERANLLTRNGELNQMGLYRAKAAIYTRAFPGAAGERMAESMLESLDPDIKTVQNGISGGLPDFSRATALTRSGMRDPHLDISDDLARTVDVYARIKDNPHLTAGTPAHQVVAKYLGQSTMFDRELNGDQERLLVHLDTIARKPTEVRSLLQRYARIVEAQPQPGQSSLFGDVPRMTRAELYDQLLGGTTVPTVDTQVGMFG